MRTTNLTLAVDSKKLTALRQYAAKKGVDINAELTDAIDKLYEKYVPAAVREYLAEREVTQPPHPSRPTRARVAQPSTEE